MSAGRICSRVVATAAPAETIRVAARRMADNDVGALVVVEPDGDKGPVGMLTDRDVVVRCVARSLEPDETTVAQVMSKTVQTVDEATPIEEVLEKMARANTRRLAVTGTEGRLVGIVSLDDILELISTEAGAISRLLERQAPHIPG